LKEKIFESCQICRIDFQHTASPSKDTSAASQSTYTNRRLTPTPQLRLHNDQLDHITPSLFKSRHDWSFPHTRDPFAYLGEHVTRPPIHKQEVHEPMLKCEPGLHKLTKHCHNLWNNCEILY